MPDNLKRALSRRTCPHVPFEPLSKGGSMVLMCVKCYAFWIRLVRMEAMEEAGNPELALKASTESYFQYLDGTEG